MLDERDLQAIKALFNEEMDKKLQAQKKDLTELMDQKLTPINERLSNIEEDLAEVRGATNYLVEWVERIDNKVKEIAG